MAMLTKDQVTGEAQSLQDHADMALAHGMASHRRGEQEVAKELYGALLEAARLCKKLARVMR